MIVTPALLRSVLPGCWSIETSSLWRPENPARGQCDVTSLVVHDICGGEILKTKLAAGWHFYNRIGGERHDLTDGQFTSPISYTDEASDRYEALAGATSKQYATLRANVFRSIRDLGSRGSHSPSIPPATSS